MDRDTLYYFIPEEIRIFYMYNSYQNYLELFGFKSFDENNEYFNQILKFQTVFINGRVERESKDEVKVYFDINKNSKDGKLNKNKYIVVKLADIRKSDDILSKNPTDIKALNVRMDDYGLSFIYLSFLFLIINYCLIFYK